MRLNAEHEAQFPIELARRVVRLFSAKGDLVLDPFIGSGTTAKVSIEQHRRYMGFEAMPKYVELATRRVRGALYGLDQHGD